MSMVDVAAMLIMGLVGYLMRRYEFPGAPMVIGLILGPVVEKSLRQSLTSSHGDFMIFLESPISQFGQGCGNTGHILFSIPH